MGIPTDCALCHTTSGFEGGSFAQHDSLYFPITSGRHAGKWSSCSDCHIQPSDFHVFTCLQCHAHDDPTDLAGKHSGVSGYAYDSDACYGCHGGRSWYRISYPYPRTPWPEMPAEVPEWAKHRPTHEARFLKRAVQGARP